MSKYGTGDKVTVSFTGDLVWTVSHHYYETVLALNFGSSTLTVNTSHVSRVRMDEPTELGAVVLTDEGEAVRYTRTQSRSGSSWHLPGCPGSFHNRPWLGLLNPRPVDRPKAFGDAIAAFEGQR